MIDIYTDNKGPKVRAEIIVPSRIVNGIAMRKVKRTETTIHIIAIICRTHPSEKFV
jgi:hypothetical protein